MYLTSFFADKEPITYMYTKRGLSQSYAPDKDCEQITADVYDVKTGNLFAGRPVSWKGHVLLNGSVDIHISAQKEYFVDHISLTQTASSQIGSVEIFTRQEEGLKKIGFYHACGKKWIEEREFCISIGYYCKNLILRINAAYVEVGIEKLDVHAAAEMDDAVYPVPKSMQLQGGVLPYAALKTIGVKDEQCRPAAEYFAERMLETRGVALTIANDGEIEFALQEIEDDSYEIQTTATGCRVCAGNKRAFFYAAYTLTQLATDTGLKQGYVSDSPMMGMRGFHLALPARKDIPFFKKLVKELLVPMRYNMIFLQISGAMRYDNYPEINEKWIESCEKYEQGEWPMPAHYGFIGRDILEKDEVAALCAYIRSFGLEIVPEVQSLSHSQYITTAYPFLAEIEEKQAEEVNLYEADERPAEFYHHNMCPSHPQYYDYIFGITNEVLEVVKPERFLHMGHDEVYILGKCKKCREKGAAAVYAEEVTRLHAFIKSKNLKMMIWSDMLQRETYSAPEAIDKIPKDIILLDFTWYFHPQQDLEDRLLDAGFQVMMGNMYSSHYTRYNARSTKKGIIGGEISTWVDCNERSYAYEGKLYDLVYSANAMWSAAYKTEYRLTYNELIKPLIWDMRERIGGLQTGERKALCLGEGASVKNIPNELLWNIPYENACLLSAQKPSEEIVVDGVIKGIRCVHGTDLCVDRVMWTPSKKIGEYVLVYEDGTTYGDTMAYGENIYKYAHTYGAPIPSFIFRHEGYTATYSAKPICGKDSEGREYTLLEFAMNNPYPDKKVEKIVIKHNQNTDANILVFAVDVII